MRFKSISRNNESQEQLERRKSMEIRSEGKCHVKKLDLHQNVFDRSPSSFHCNKNTYRMQVHPVAGNLVDIRLAFIRAPRVNEQCCLVAEGQHQRLVEMQ